MPNRLAAESSPYLQQHADNPVDWYPWADDAFAEAKQSGKPVLLSIGYSACHWCHVMAHESFENDETAELMNRLFVNIKVDREERPDIDKIYQTAHQLLTHRGGGWPLTMFLDGATQRPFFGGTYFPREARHGMPAFADVLSKVASYYSEQGEAVEEQSEQLLSIFRKLEPEPAATDTVLDGAPPRRARNTFAQSFDKDFGGFGAAPKFPHPTTIEFLLRYWRGTAHSEAPDVESLYMASLTLARMADGGLFDHVGGGFSRYCVDRAWQIPHFEKMLYDNGPLLALYADAAIATGEENFVNTANETADWMIADMLAPNGGFYAARDADSEGEEGLYYLWTPDEATAILGDEYPEFAACYGLDKDANFEGRWHLTVQKDFPGDGAKPRFAAARKKLLARRLQRVPPMRDEKQLTAWNALAIRGMAKAGRALDRPELIDVADRAVCFIRENLLVDGRLYASYKDGEARFPAYLDDHAFLLDALLSLLESRWKTVNLEFAIELANLLLEHFSDSGSGGFFFTANDHESLIHRTKTLADEAVPSGNGVAAIALQRLGFLLGDSRYLDAAEKTLLASWRAIQEYPHGHVSLLSALDEHLSPPEIIVIRGNATEIARWQSSAAKLYAPRRLVFAIASGEENLPGALSNRIAVDGETVAYRCVGTHCELPVTTWEALARQLSER